MLCAFVSSCCRCVVLIHRAESGYAEHLSWCDHVNEHVKPFQLNHPSFTLTPSQPLDNRNTTLMHLTDADSQLILLHVLVSRAHFFILFVYNLAFALFALFTMIFFLHRT